MKLAKNAFFFCYLHWRVNINHYNLCLVSHNIKSFRNAFLSHTTHFALNKFESLQITISYNALPLITFDYAFHASSTKPHPCTSLSCSHNVHFWLQHSLVNLMNIDSRYSLSHVLCEMEYYLSHNPCLTYEDDNKIYISIYLFHSLNWSPILC